MTQLQCGPPLEMETSSDCTLTPDPIRMLLTQPQCTDRAIAALRKPNDLAAAYYVRAQRNDDPADFLRALQVLENVSGADFNRALIQEQLGLTTEAIASWNAYLRTDPDGQWAAEARQHRDALQTRDAASAQWATVEKEIEAALQQGDRDRLARLIAPFPWTAQNTFEMTLLPRWADANHLDWARTYAEALSQRLHGDRFHTDLVAAIANATPEKRRVLLEGHRLFSEGGTADSSSFARAAQLLRGNSPLWLVATMKSTALQPLDEAVTLLTTLENDPDAAKYTHVLARIQSFRAYQLFELGDYIGSTRSYESAIKKYRELDDHESVLKNQIRLIGNHRTAGEHGRAWRTAFGAMREFHRVVSPQERHVLLGETALTAVTMGAPAIAMQYQNMAVDVVRKWKGKEAVVRLN
ncbi:MAG: hypothetical protein ACLGH0_09160, partial [Thermoanaerobaculia bacterium]